MSSCCTPGGAVLGSGQGGGGTPSAVFPPLYIAAEDMQTVLTDFAVNGTTPLVADSNNAALLVRLFPGEADEDGVGFSVLVPAGATAITITTISRAETTPGGAVVQQVNLYERGIPDGAAVDAWSAANPLTAVSLGANEFFVYTTTSTTLAALGLTAGQLHQFELTTEPTGTTLTGGWALLGVVVGFS